MVTTNKPAKKKPVRRTKKRDPYVWEQALALASSVPGEELAKAPRDGARNTHHYLYGAPKRS
jgi:hypothetical protein